MSRMSKHDKEGPPDWSCGGYVYEDARPPEFGVVEHDGVLSPFVRNPGPAAWAIPVSEDTVVATLRWLRPKECPVHGTMEPSGAEA